MKQKNMLVLKAVVAVAVAMAFILPGATVVANVGTIGVTSNSENTVDIENIVEISTNSDETTTSDTSNSIEVDSVDSAEEDVTDIPVTTGDNAYVDSVSGVRDLYDWYYDDSEDLWYYTSGMPERPERPEWDTSTVSAIDAASYIDGDNEALPPTGNTIYVDDDADPSWYNETQVKTIQEGVDNATAGDTVYVYNGTYYEHVLVNKTLNLIGESRDNVVVHGGNSGKIFLVTVDNVNISTLTVRNGEYGIYFEPSSYSKIVNCKVYNARYGIIIRGGSSNCDIINVVAYNMESVGFRLISAPYCTIEDCELYNCQAGIYITESEGCSIVNCNSHHNPNINLWNGGAGIVIQEGSPNCRVENCNLYDNTDFGLLIAYDSSGCVVSNCNMYRNIYDPDAMFPPWYKATGMTIEGSSECEITDCSFFNNDNGIYIGEESSDCVLRNNVFDNNIYSNFDVAGWYIEDFYQDVDASNAINGRPILYLVEESDLTFNETNPFGFLGFVSCTNITVENLDMTGGGVLLVDTSDSTISNVNSHDTRKGFFIMYSPNCDIINCKGYNNIFGIWGSSENLIDSEFYNNDYGIYLEMEWWEEEQQYGGAVNRGNVTNCRSYNNKYGFMEQKGANITGCEVYDNSEYGIELEWYSEEGEYGSTLRDNSFHDNPYNFRVSGSIPSEYYHDIDTSNTVNGKSIHYRVLENDIVIDGATTDVGLVILASCDNVTVRNVDASYNEYGILLVDSREPSLITNCNLSNNKYGIKLNKDSYNHQITNCNCFNNEQGISFQWGSDYNVISNCNLYNNSEFGYWSQLTEGNSILDCDIYGNGYAAYDYAGSQTYPNSLQYGGPGVMIHYRTPGNFVENCSIHDNFEGIFVFDESCPGQTFRNNEVYNNTDRGICINEGPNCVIENCTSYNNGYGIEIGEENDGASMRDCTIYDNTYNFGLATYTVDIDTSNTINGKPIVSLEGESDLVFDETSNVGWLGLFSCTNITMTNLDINGILLVGTTESTISNVDSHSSRNGICLSSSTNNNIKNSIGRDNARYGITLSSASGTDITGCTVYNNQVGGIYVYSSNSDITDCEIYGHKLYDEIPDTLGYGETGLGVYAYSYNDNTIINCDAYDNYYGMYLYRSSNNDITKYNSYNNNYSFYLYWYTDNNEITNCDIYGNGYGFYFDRRVNGNVIHHNNIASNDYNAWDTLANQWDDGIGEGNHWSDYTGVDENPEDGIGDTPYEIPGTLPVSNQDNYPLMEPLLETPSLLLPADGSGTDDLTPTFDWTDIKPLYPVTYTLLVANDTEFTNIVIEETDLTESEYTPTEDMPADITYYWKVQALVGIYDTDWSETWSLYIGTDLTPPTTPDLIYPTDELTTVEPMLFFDWTDAYDAFGIDYYILQVATDDAFADIIAEETPADSECALALATADDYYWRTQAVDNNGLLGDWSETWMFTRLVDTTPPTVELTYPVGGEDLRGTVEITWTATDDYTPSSVLLIDIDYRCGGDWQVMSSGEENDGTYTWDTTLYPDSEYYEIRITTEDDWGSIGSDRSYPAITVDNTAPVTVADLYPTDPDGENDWYVSNVHVILVASDETSGVNYTMYRLNEGDWQEYTGPFTVDDDDEYTLEFYSVDYAGNEETVTSVNFKIDKTAPTIELTVENIGLMKWLLTATVSDETSGVAKVEFYLDGELLGTVTEPPYEWECSERGTAHAIVYDNAGNDAISDPVPVSVSQSQIQSSSNLIPVQRKISLISLGGLTGIQNIQRRV